jgi:hypothetical protein
MKMGISSAIVISGALALFLTGTTAQAQNTTRRISPRQAQTAVRVPVAPDALSEGTMRVIRRFQNGATPQELLRYTKTTPTKFNLSVADVNYLKDLGVSTDVVFAMIRNEGARPLGFANGGQRQTVQSWATTAPADEPRSRNADRILKRGQAIVEAAGSSAPVANSDDATAPKYYDSTDNTRDAVRPSAYQYGTPRPGYDNRFLSPGDPRYNNYNGYNGYNGYPSGNSANPYYQRFDNPRRYAP